MSTRTGRPAFAVLGMAMAAVAVMGASRPLEAEVPAMVAAAPQRLVELRPQVSGRITTVNFEPEQVVRQGDVLFTIDAGPYQAAFEKARSTLAKAQWRYEFALRDHARVVGHVAARSATDAELAASVAALERDNAEVQADKAALAMAQSNLEHTRVIAPVSGKVGQPAVGVGSLVVSGQTPLTTLASAEPMRFGAL